jgi:tetratricopeptide (TPR) repeat protein
LASSAAWSTADHPRAAAQGIGRQAYEQAQRAAEEANIPDLGGLAALNLGVLFQMTGNFDRAHASYAYAKRMFAKVHNDGRRLAAMYNSATLSLEQGDAVAAHDMYERVHDMAAELKVVDIEVGALAGAGLAALALGYVDQALLSRRRATERSAVLGATWYQGRELLEALEVRYLVATERHAQAGAAFDKARALATTIDEGAALWLGRVCPRAGPLQRRAIRRDHPRGARPRGAVRTATTRCAAGRRAQPAALVARGAGGAPHRRLHHAALSAPARFGRDDAPVSRWRHPDRIAVTMPERRTS